MILRESPIADELEIVVKKQCAQEYDESVNQSSRFDQARINDYHVEATKGYDVASGNLEFKLYSSRWLVLAAITLHMLARGLEWSFFAVTDILYEHLDTNVERATSWWPASMAIIILTAFPLAKALDQYGLKTMARFGALVILASHCLLAFSMFPPDQPLAIPKQLRFGFFTLGNMGVQLFVTNGIGFAAKLSISWFATNEQSKAVTIWGCGYGISAGIVNLLIPRFIINESRLDILSYIYLVTGLLICLATFLLIRRSQPKCAPSHEAVQANVSSSTSVSKSLKIVSCS